MRRGTTISEAVGQKVEDTVPSDVLDLADLLLKQDATRSFGRHYQMVSQIGSGAFGAVYKAKSLISGEVRAVKVMPKSDVKEDTEALATELEAMIRLQHPNVLAFYEFFEEKKAICLVMEFCDGGDFSTLNKTKESDEEVRVLFRDVTLGVAYCHAQGIAHRDLKFENSLICKGPHRRIAKVIDFGLAAIRREADCDQWLDESLGTKYFIAPEVIVKMLYGVKCDAWSLGVMIYIVLTGEHPFAEEAFKLQTKRLFHCIQTATLRTRPMDKAKLGEDPRRLIGRLLERDPERRIDADEALKEEWLRPRASLAEMDLRSLTRGESRQLAHSISTLGRTSRFQRVILMLTAHHAKLAEVETMRIAFMAQDKNGDGVISIDELRAAMQSCDARCDEKELRNRFHNLDANENLKVNYVEWLSATIEESTITADGNMRELFDKFDKDHNGRISRAELCDIVGQEEAARVLNESDSSQDGSLDWSEFKELILALARLRSDPHAS